MTVFPTDTFGDHGLDRLLPWRRVKDLTGISRTTAWRLQNAGVFPRPVQISPGRVGWRESEVTDWKRRLAPKGVEKSPARPRPRRTRLVAPEDPPPASSTLSAAPAVKPRRTRRPSVAAGQLSFDF